MSKIGKRPLKIPDGIMISINADAIDIKGKNGNTSVKIPRGIKAEIIEGEIRFTPMDNTKQTLSNWGTVNALTKNAISGVVMDFTKELSIIGIGFKAAVEGKNLVLNVGFSHPVKFVIPGGIKITVEKNIIRVAGQNKWLVGETAANIRNIRKPEPYQGKGIRYKDEVVRKKAGKKAAAAAGAPAK